MIPITYFTVYSLEAMKNKTYHVVRMNIPNDTENKKEQIRKVYPWSDYHIIEHVGKVNSNWVFNN